MAMGGGTDAAALPAALASVQADMFVQAVQTHAEQIRDIFTAHVIEDLVDVNWGPDEPSPRLIFDPIGSHQDATAAALQLLVQAGLLTPDQAIEQSVRQRLGLPSTAIAAPLSEHTSVGPTGEIAASRRRVPVAAGQGHLW